MLSGVDVTQRLNHTFCVSYVPLGRDATVATDGPDLKYKNNYDFPIYIKTTADKGVMTAQIYGDTSKNKKVEVYSEVIETVNPTLTYKNDPDLPLGKEEIEEPGNIGYTTVTYKVVDGKKEVVSKDRYKMSPRIIRTGTGPASDIQAVENQNQQQQEQIEMQQTQQEQDSAQEQQENTIF